MHSLLVHLTKTDKDSYTFEVDLPGYGKEDVEVTQNDYVLGITLLPSNTELTWGPFNFEVPFNDVDMDNVSVSMDKGVLRMVVSRVYSTPKVLEVK